MRTSQRTWTRPVTAVFVAVLTPFLVTPLPTQGNLLTGPVRELTVTLTEGTNMAAAPAPDGATIVLAVQQSLWSVPSGGGEATQLTGWEVEATWPVFSPDGSRIAFQNYSGSNYHIWTMRPDGSDPVQVTSGFYDHREPAWSPDGRKIAFSSDRAGNGAFDVWTIDLATGTYEQRTSRTTNEHSPAWSPDGAWIAYADGRFVFAVNAAGERRQLASVPSGSVQAPSWSPDGQALAYYTNTRQIVLGGQVVTSGDEDVFPFPVRWLPDGRILYTADGKVRVRNPDGTNPGDIAFRAALTVQRPLRQPKDHGFDDKGPRSVLGLNSPALSPDGTKIAFVALNDVWVMAIGRKPVRLTNDRFVDMDPTWSADGGHIYFASDRHGDGSPDIYAIEVATGGVTRISNIPETSVVTPVPSPDGRSVAFISTDQALMIYDIATGQSRRVVNQAAGSTVGRPTWSPDGQTIALTDMRRLNSRFREGHHLIRTVDVATGAATFHEPAPPPNQIADRVEAGPVWSPDGQWMAFIMNATLHVLPVDTKGVPTGPAVQLTDHVADMPSWGGDSRTILYVSNAKPKTIQVDGTGPRDIPFDLTWRPAVPAGRTVIHAGGLWDGVSPVIQRDVDIVVVGNRIRQVRPHRSQGRAQGDRFIDASHLIVMPGLWDAHIHPRTKDSMGPVMAIFLSYGITSVTSVGWAPYHTLLLKESLDAGTMIGPRLITSGPLYEGDQIFYSQSRPSKDEHILDLEMAKARALKLDYLKGYVRTPVRHMAKIAQTAHEMGVPSGTHFLAPGIQTGLSGTTHLSATSRLGISLTQSGGGVSYQDVIALYSQGDFDLTTTHNANSLIGADPGIVDDRRVQLLMPVQYIAGLRNAAQNPPTPSQLASIRQAVEAPTTILRAGGLVALGTDTPLRAPAITLHMALRGLAFGMSTHEALQTATINAAKFSGVGHEVGTVEAGRLADLIMIRGNPLEDLANTANVELIMKNGLTFTVDDILRPYEEAEAANSRRRCGPHAVPCGPPFANPVEEDHDH